MIATITAILIENKARYPLWNEEDIYKLVHQAAMGNEHAITNEAGVRRWMEQELVEMGEGPLEPLIDPISPDATIVRVHLRPLVEQQLPVDELLSTFFTTPSAYQGSKEQLASWLDEALSLQPLWADKYQKERAAAFFEQMKNLGFPAVHHSERYIAEYRPAYRVVLRSLLPVIFFT